MKEERGILLKAVQAVEDTGLEVFEAANNGEIVSIVARPFGSAAVLAKHIYAGERRDLTLLFGAKDVKKTFEILRGLVVGKNLLQIAVGDYVRISLDIHPSKNKSVLYEAVHDDLIAVVTDISENKVTFNFEEPVFFAGINAKNTNDGGFKESALSEYLNDAFLFAMGIGDFLIPNKDGQKITLPTQFEVFGSGDKIVNFHESPHQLEYFKNIKNRIKVKDNDTKWWWTSTPYSASASGFVSVTNAGHTYNSGASSSGGAAPAFCVG